MNRNSGEKRKKQEANRVRTERERHVGSVCSKRQARTGRTSRKSQISRQNKSHTPREGLCAPHSLLCFLIGKSYIEVVNRPQKLTNCAAIHYNELGFALHSFYMNTLLPRHRFGCFFTLCTNNPF